MPGQPHRVDAYPVEVGSAGVGVRVVSPGAIGRVGPLARGDPLARSPSPCRSARRPCRRGAARSISAASRCARPARRSASSAPRRSRSSGRRSRRSVRPATPSSIGKPVVPTTTPIPWSIPQPDVLGGMLRGREVDEHLGVARPRAASSASARASSGACEADRVGEPLARRGPRRPPRPAPDPGPRRPPGRPRGPSCRWPRRPRRGSRQGPPEGRRCEGTDHRRASSVATVPGGRRARASSSVTASILFSDSPSVRISPCAISDLPSRDIRPPGSSSESTVDPFTWPFARSNSTARQPTARGHPRAPCASARRPDRRSAAWCPT